MGPARSSRVRLCEQLRCESDANSAVIDQCDTISETNAKRSQKNQRRRRERTAETRLNSPQQALRAAAMAAGAADHLGPS